ncbi:MAG TPA: transcription antitermination factor NusB [Candidatus Dormibacteraeota bacterium]|nr:transcription antitermination factor NusB [Candidatus Dormibacteraeota bacterium]
MGKRHQARELALQVLFELESSLEGPDAALTYHLAEMKAEASVAAFAGELVKGVISNREELDRRLEDAAPNWQLEQMAKVDRVILRMAIYEITISKRVPLKAAINESIELAKTYSGEESSRFVNGVLGAVAAAGSAT